LRYSLFQFLSYRVYNIALYSLAPLIWLRLLWQARRDRTYLDRWHQRLGFGAKQIPGGIWLHAVSVGEFLAAVPLIRRLQELYPNRLIIISTTTVTGAARVKATTFTHPVYHCYAPYDFPGAIKRCLWRLQPSLLILMETELWPNLLHICYQKQIPVLLANARMSAKSAAGYARFSTLTKSMLSQLTYAAIQYPADAERLTQLGLPKERQQITGSIKFDLELPPNLLERAQELRQCWDSKRPVWIAASTHAGEDEQVLSAFQRIKQALPNSLLILVPRHPERFKAVTELSNTQGFNTFTRSSGITDLAKCEVFVGDTLGELLLFYACADVAFVGGSLIPSGCHNPLEPAALSLPVLFGPHTFNFASICEQLLQQGAALSVSAENLAATVLELLTKAEQRQQMGAKAQHFVAQNRGALQKHIEIIKQVLMH
jgi:3-deoxy-D-manno-octulosonic-acid transferase